MGQVSQEFPCIPEASLCLQGCRRKKMQRGIWRPWHVAVQCRGPALCKPFGGHWSPVLQSSTAGRDQHQCPAMHRSPPDLCVVWAFVNQIVFHPQHLLKRNQGKSKFECRARALCKGMFQSGNSGIMCFVSSLDLPVSFCSPKYFLPQCDCFSHIH